MPSPRRILVAREPVDFRCSIDGLAAFVELHLHEAPLSGQMFVFFNRRRNAIKLLVWDRGGFILVLKRLERGRFGLPATPDLSLAELAALIEGIDLTKARRLPRWNPDHTPCGGPQSS